MGVMVDFIVYWLFGEEEAQVVLKDPMWESIAVESIPHWQEVKFMVEGSVVATDYAKRSALQQGNTRSLFSDIRGFEDALETAGHIGRHFSSFWNEQCEATKDSLVALDTTGTGRVKLSDFYGANHGGEWRFGESEAYLRELGVLDETSSVHGKQVLIANYLQGTSNCIVMRQHYLICCANECETILADIEEAVGAPMADVDSVVNVVGNMTDDADDYVILSEALKNRLEQLARRHGGKVPLHGRLFAQWLHYVFPRDCVFPHTSGAVAVVTPGQFGAEYLVTEDEMKKVAQEVHEEVIMRDLAGLSQVGNVSLDSVSWMTQWSEDEELLTDYSELRGRKEEHLLAVSGLAVVAMVAVWSVVGRVAAPKAEVGKVHHI